MAQPEPERAEEAEPDAFSISVAGVTGAETFAVRRGDTLGALQLKVAEKLRTPPDQQLLALEGKPLQAHLLDTERTLAAHGIAGPVSLTLSPQPAPGAAELTAALKAEAEAALRVAIEPCAQPTRMKLRKADGAHKHRRWFWLTVGEDGLQIRVRWSPNEDKSAAWQWKRFRSAPPKQRRVTAMRATGEGRSQLGLTMEAEGSEPVIAVAESEGQRSAWLVAWRLVEVAAERRETGIEAVKAGELTVAGVKASQKVTEEWKCEGRIVESTVPPSATQATIEAWGASGGDATGIGDEGKGGRGAHLRGVFALVPGQRLRLLVGGAAPPTEEGSGGGGASFVVGADGSPLLVAGG
eukprot:COSAG04_NODE_4578_length_2006_cov_2.462507_1_plen_352_part_10